MAFINNKQRAAYFAKKSGKTPMNPLGKTNAMPMTMQPTNTPPPTPGVEQVKVLGVPRIPKFGRIRKMFKF